MTLYRIEYRKPNEPDTHVAVLPDGGLLVPVEPCVHGNIDRHDTEYDPIKDRTLDGHLCPGAGVGKETP